MMSTEASKMYESELNEGPSGVAQDAVVHRSDCVQGSACVAQQPSDDIGGLLIGALGPMGVDLHRGGAVRMSEPRGHGRYGHASVEELGCLEVAEVV